MTDDDVNDLLVNHLAASGQLHVLVRVEPYEDHFRALATIQDLFTEEWLVASAHGPDHASAFTGATSATAALLVRLNIAAMLRSPTPPSDET